MKQHTSKPQAARLKRPMFRLVTATAFTCSAAILAAGTQAQVLNTNSTGVHNGFYYSFWKDNGDASFELLNGGRYKSSWSNSNNWVGGKGWNPGSADKVVNYSGSYNVDNSQNSYLALYGWTKNPLIEYYVIESYGSYNPSNCGGGTNYGTFQSDGATYNVRRCQRVQQPSIEGTATFYQYFSVRTPKKGFGNISGTITVANHFDYWASKGLNLGNHNYMVMATEGYQSRGSSDITVSDGGTATTSSSVVSVSSASSVSSTSTQQPGGGSCAGVNVYPNWTAKDWSGGAFNHANAGDQMVYQNALYKANWYTTTTPGSDASWSRISACGSTPVSSSSAVSVSSTTSVGVSSSASSISSAQSCEEMCQWYQDAPRPLCDNQSSGWGYENGQSCIGRTTCESQYGGGGVISSCTNVSSSVSSVASSSSVPPVVSSSSSVVSSSSSSAGQTPTDGVFRVDATGNITKSGEVLPIRCGSWFGLEGQHEPKNAEHNADGAPMELYMGNMWWANGGQGTGRTIQQTMDEITALGINTVRFPIAPQTLDANDPQGIGAAQNGGVLKNHSSVLQDNARQAMEDFIKLADQNGINVIVDIHSCSNYVGWRAGRLDAKPPYADAERINYDFTREGYSCSATGNPSSVTQIDAYGESQWLEDLKEIASLSEKLGVNNIMAVDIFNEPWDYTWAEWKELAEKAYAAISAENDDILIMVEGIAGGTAAGVEVPHGDDATNPNWGENFYPAADAPLDIPKERLIISPHTYGPSVFVQKQFLDQNQAGCAGLEGDEAADAKCNIVIQPDVLEAGWEEHFGFLRDEGYAMIIGEFGGAMDWPVGAENGVNWLHVTEKVDQQWQEAFVDYMVKEDIQGCYWSINPESADTGGLYKHSYIPDVNESGWGTWEEFDTRKVNLLKRFWGM